MKKFFTLIAAVAMAASVNAVSFQPTDEQVAAGKIPAMTKLLEDDSLLTVMNAYETQVAASHLTINGVEYTNKFQLRTDANPSAENTLGKEKLGSTSLIVNVAYFVPVKFTVYGRRQTVDGKCVENDGKDLLMVDHDDFSTPLEASDYETELIGTDGKYATFVKTYTLKPSHQYTVYRGGSTMNIYKIEAIKDPTTGINSAVVEVESADAPAYNLAGQKVGENAKGIIIQNGKKYIRK